MTLKFRFAVLLSLLFFVAANAQDTTQNRRYEVSALLVPQYTSYLNATDAADARTDYTKSFGVAYELRVGFVLRRNFALQTGLCWSQQGQNYAAKPSSNSIYTYQRSLEYLKLPLTAQYRLTTSKNMRFTAEAGLQVAKLLHADFQRDAQPYLYDGTNGNYNEIQKYKPFDVAAICTLGAQFNANNRLFINMLLRADISLQDIDNKQIMYNYNIERQTIRSENRSASHNLSCGLGLGVGYRF